MSRRPRSSPGDGKGQAKAGLPGCRQRGVAPEPGRAALRPRARAAAAVRSPGLPAGAGSRGRGGEGTRWAGSSVGGGGPGAAGSSPRVCLSAARRAEAVRRRAGRGCRPAPSPRPCPGPSVPAAARAQRPSRAPQPRAPQPRSPAPAAASSMGNLLGGVSFREPTTVEDCDSTWQTDSEPEPEEPGPGGGGEGPGQEPEQPAQPPERVGGRPRAGPAPDEDAEAAGAEQVRGPAVASGWARAPLPLEEGRRRGQGQTPSDPRAQGPGATAAAGPLRPDLCAPAAVPRTRGAWRGPERGSRPLLAWGLTAGTTRKSLRGPNLNGCFLCLCSAAGCCEGGVGGTCLKIEDCENWSSACYR